ncbi:MAG TPA: hypothetical protein VEI47_03055 [Gemmatimonadales bacterium]|jgi:hypothetical protein|nr:hypothetical protein [Gemmatimonadales bacterium]
MARSYNLDKVLVAGGERRPATWTFGGEAVSGFEHSYTVTDTNFPSRNQWEFIVRLPKASGDRIEVRPRTTPAVTAWAELPDRSLTFVKATLGAARGKRYCPVALADVTGERSRDVVRADERDRLPRWFTALRNRMRAKRAVKTTRGTDGESLVILVPSDDYAGMIRLFFATKVWVLKEGFRLPTSG